MPRHDPLDDATEHWFERDHYSLRAYVVNSRAISDESPDFVLIHGIGVSSKYFVPLAALLAEHGRVIVFDLPGFGGVPKPERVLYVEGFAAVVRSALDELGVARPVLIGHSMGAQVAVELCVQQPRFDGAVVLVGPVVEPCQRSTRTILRAFAKSSLRERPGAALRSIQGYLRTAPSWFITVFPAMMKYPIEHRITYLRGALAILRGEADLVCTRDWVTTLATAATRADVSISIVPGASHQFVVDHAPAVVRAALGVDARRPR